MLLPMKDILMDAKKGGYGCTAPNIISAATCKAVFDTARKMKAPVVIDQGGEGDQLREAADWVKFYAPRYPDVVATLNLDHGGKYEAIVTAMQAGFNSVMVDRSTLSFEDNVREVAEIVKIAHALGISVEAELGHVGQGYEYEATRDGGLTNPDEALAYIEQTDVDCLAVAVGTSHGVYTGTPHLEFDLLKKLSDMLPNNPLVLHGGSGTGDENLQKAVEIGIQKVNLFTDLATAGGVAVEEYLKNEKATRILPALEGVGIKGYSDKLAHYMELFHSAGKAN